MRHLRLTAEAFGILAKALTMYQFVPFLRATKSRRRPADDILLAQLHDRFVVARDESANKMANSNGVALDRAEIQLMTTVLDEVLQEGQASPYDLELHVAPLQAVSDIRQRLSGYWTVQDFDNR